MPRTRVAEGCGGPADAVIWQRNFNRGVKYQVRKGLLRQHSAGEALLILPLMGSLVAVPTRSVAPVCTLRKAEVTVALSLQSLLIIFTTAIVAAAAGFAAAAIHIVTGMISLPYN